ncbi:MAG: amino acid ABC transporter permease [Candidatus Babeliaceae bacterium]
MNIVDTFFMYGPLLLKGTLATFVLWLFCSLLSFMTGFITGILRSHALRIKGLSRVLDIVTFIFRAVPLYVQLLFAYFVIPDLLAFNLSAWWAGILALGFCSGAYTSEIVRSGINAVPQGQWEASFVLGYTALQQLRFIILPQVMRTILPVLLNEYNMVLKSTAILASIGTLELTKIGMNIATRSLDPFPIYTVIALIYILLTSIFIWCTKIIERRFIA